MFNMQNHHAYSNSQYKHRFSNVKLIVNFQQQEIMHQAEALAFSMATSNSKSNSALAVCH